MSFLSQQRSETEGRESESLPVGSWEEQRRENAELRDMSLLTLKTMKGPGKKSSNPSVA